MIKSLFWVPLPFADSYVILKKYLKLAFLDRKIEIIIVFILQNDGMGWMKWCKILLTMTRMYYYDDFKQHYHQLWKQWYGFIEFFSLGFLSKNILG